MDLNGTFFIELLIFSAFYYFVKSCLWPRYAGVLEERRVTIAQGLQAAKEGQLLLSEAHKEAENIMQKAQEKAQKLVETTQSDMLFFKEQVREEMEAFKIHVQKEAVAECDQMRQEFILHAREHYVRVAAALCERFFDSHPEFCLKAMEDVLENNQALVPSDF